MALLIAPLFTAGIAVGGIQNANAGGGECDFTIGATATVTLILGEESGNISKQVECEQQNNGKTMIEIEDVRDVTVDSCTDNVPLSTITASISSLTVGFTADWIETITLVSVPGVASFMCDIEFLVDTFQGNVFILQTVTINVGPFCMDRVPNIVPATIYKKFPTDDSSNLWVTPGGDVNMTRLSSGGFDGWEVKASPGETVDVVIGSHLNDLIHGGKGNDVLCGDDPRISVSGVGDDELRGGKGSDAIWGTYPGAATDGSAADTDTLKGGQGDDTLWGQDGPDTLEGGHGEDILICSQTDGDGHMDTVEGGHDDDTDVNCLETGPDFDDVDLGKDD